MFFFEAKPGSIIIWGDERYYIYSSETETEFVASAFCPHKGGPLNMGEYVESGCKVRCPCTA